MPPQAKANVTIESAARTDIRARKQEIADLLDHYASLLDERRFDEWLALFTEDCYYEMILLEDYLKDTNVLAIGEDKARLAGRIEVGQTVERDRTIHLISALSVQENDGVVGASANFAVLCMNNLKCSGRYQFEFARRGDALLVKRCVAVLYIDVIHGTIYLPV